MIKTYKTLRNRTLISIAALTLVSCGLGDKEEGEDEASDILSTFGGGNYSQSSETKVGRLGDLPLLDSFLSTDASLALTAVGEPPVFSEITTDADIEKYLTGDSAVILASLNTAVATGNWEGEGGVEEQVGKFRKAQSKCRIMQHSAEQLQSMQQNTTSLCYIQNVQKQNLLTFDSGVEHSEGPLVPGLEKKIIELSMEGEPEQAALALQDEDEGGEFKIVFNVSPAGEEQDVYQLALNFCEKGSTAAKFKKTGRDLIRVDNSAGLLTLISRHRGKESSGGNDAQYRFMSTIVASLIENSDGTFAFDTSSERYADMRGSWKGTYTDPTSGATETGENKWRGRLAVLGDVLTTKISDEFKMTTADGTFEGRTRGVSMVKFSGTGISDTKFSEGAGRFKFNFKGSDDTEPFEGDERVAFSYDETASPAYTTVSTLGLLTTIGAHSFSEDSVLKSAKEDALGDAEDDGDVCNAEPTSVYILDMGTTEFQTIQANCEPEWKETPDMCSKVDAIEEQFWTALDQCTNCEQNEQVEE